MFKRLLGIGLVGGLLAAGVAHAAGDAAVAEDAVFRKMGHAVATFPVALKTCAMSSDASKDMDGVLEAVERFVEAKGGKDGVMAYQKGLREGGMLAEQEFVKLTSDELTTTCAQFQRNLPVLLQRLKNAESASK